VLHHLIFQPFGTKAAVEDGKTVLQAAQNAGYTYRPTVAAKKAAANAA
jgi:uncharacterized 2Fe-2S/4Fe-4S cluster protein (DUF4445 family)